MNKTFLMTSAATLSAVGVLFLSPVTASAHCDTMDGPVIGDAQTAIKENNINYIAKWVSPEEEANLTDIFNQTMEVRDDSPEAQELADQYLFENLVRVHRAGEGAPYTGVKPEGFPMAEEIVAADESIKIGNLDPLKDLVESEEIPELEESLSDVLATKDFDTADLDAGREYVMNYVTFTHLAEGEELEGGHVEEGHEEAEQEEAVEVDEIEVEKSTTNWFSWGLAGLFFITTIIGFTRKKA
ncbi:hypothetical protein SAMN05878443_0081 [Carnobacterium alterfunditum]|uniref:LysM domain-containing protein n=1 Tax=Carnobacterium alterfunditum TaxID=28230 RepID=A0A1N6EMB0_9LACT|nr:DUF6448 family protein [Carnobacterium alterfunditum]SIN84158.1 hypothetical protein SAMN05878443_0081 [Carnobacterium alterfunditum]